MLGSAINSLKPRLQALQPGKVCIENLVFQLHYKATVIILLIFMIIVCAREYFGEHIKCIADKAVPDNVLNNYCFFMGTFSVVRHYNETLLKNGFLPHPGVGPVAYTDETIRHKYYQWVPFVLFLQSVCFYVPHYVWKKKEGGRMKALIVGLHNARLALHEEDMTVKDKKIPSRTTIARQVDVISRDILLRLRISRTWSTWLVSMEIVNFLHLILEILVVNRFLNGYFISLGPRVVAYNMWHDISNPLDVVFPKVTKCLFHKYGPSGTIQNLDALCVMGLNIAYDKIYTILWFWFAILFALTVIALAWRVVSCWLYYRSVTFSQLLFRRFIPTKPERDMIKRIVDGCRYADWLFLYYLAKNVQGFIFEELLMRLDEDLKRREAPLYTGLYPTLSAGDFEAGKNDKNEMSQLLGDVKKDT